MADLGALRSAPGAASARSWTLLTNHGHVLVFVHRNPDARIRDIASTVGITERATLNILRDLEDGGYITRVPQGRRTHYVVNARRPFRHPAEADHQVGDLLALFA
jgi:predicted ArsR family transcriptional regulator